MILSMPMTDLIRAYTFPDKHARELPIDRIVCDDKVDEGWVNELTNNCGHPSELKAIVVVKHPKQDIYTVLDGHHRFEVARRSGQTTIRAAVVDDYIGLGFHLTKHGTFQPPPEFTKFIRVPIKRFTIFMERFLKNPREVIQQQLQRR